MVKPDQGEILTYQNPWLKENTVWCRPDFSDLPEAVEIAESTWNHGALEDIRQDTLKAAMNVSCLADQVASTLKSAFHGT